MGWTLLPSIQSSEIYLALLEAGLKMHGGPRRKVVRKVFASQPQNGSFRKLGYLILGSLQ